MAKAKKRHLNKDEVALLREIMDKSPQGSKPSVRFFAKMFGVNQPSIIKSLGGWDGIQRGRPSPLPKPKIIQPGGSPIKIEEATTKLEPSEEEAIRVEISK